VRLCQLEGEITAPADLRQAGPAAYDAVVPLGSDRLDSGEDADARTIVTYLLCGTCSAKRRRRTSSSSCSIPATPSCSGGGGPRSWSARSC
jgi:hypothetical protein